VKLQLHWAGGATLPHPTGAAALGAPGLAALLLVQILPVLHPTVHETHGGDPAHALVAPLRRGPHGADCAPWGGASGRIAALGATLDFHHGPLVFTQSQPVSMKYRVLCYVQVRCYIPEPDISALAGWRSLCTQRCAEQGGCVLY
jgi:hypothetical protein